MNHDLIFKRKEVMGRRLKYTEIIIERLGLSRTEKKEKEGEHGGTCIKTQNSHH
jgi:hypothetical protein